MYFHIITFMTLVWGSPLSAEIYKCLHQGQTTYQDIGCQLHANEITTDLSAVHAARNAPDDHNPKEIHLKQEDDSHFRINGRMNGYRVRMLIDTGASLIVVSDELAKKLSLPHLEEVEANTGNGQTTGYMTKIETLELHDIILTDVAAVIAPNISENTILLGMNALKDFKIIKDKKSLHLIYEP